MGSVISEDLEDVMKETPLTFVKDVWHTSLNLRIQDGEPKFLSTDDLSSFTLAFILFVQFFKLLAICFTQSGSLVWTEQGPFRISLYSCNARD